jgi:hypothetical protein
MSLTQFFYPPQYWQQFEDLTEAVFPYVFGDPTPAKIGRPGQSQQGVDVHGLFRNKDSVGIQCKRMDDLDENSAPYPGGPVTKTLLYDEYNKALGFQPQLNLWILATTAKRDVRIQEVARLLDEDSRKNSQFRVKLWFWDDYVTFLNSYDDLVARYYSSVMKLRTPLDQDKLTLEVFSMALLRQAFHAPFCHEDIVDFQIALEDSHTALKTGELPERQTRHIIRKAIGGWRSINNPAWSDACKSVCNKIQNLRTQIQSGLDNKTIIPSGRSVNIPDKNQEQALYALRHSCVTEMNAVLAQAGLPQI